MSDTTFFYPTREQNDAFKTAAADAGVQVMFDRDKGAYRLRSEEISAEAREAIDGKLSGFRTPEAEAAWAADREAGLAEREALKGKAAEKAPAKEPGKEKVAEEGKAKGKESPHSLNPAPAIAVYPAISQRDEYKKLVAETEGTTARYVTAKQAEAKGMSAHFEVKTNSPAAFAAFQGAEAEARFKGEYEQSVAGKGQEDPSVEAARNEAGRRAQIFFNSNKEKGFELPIGDKSAALRQSMLDSMRVASDAQIKAMMAITMNHLGPLRDKETQIRADHAGMPVDQFKALSFEDQRALAKTEDGKNVGLSGEDFMRSRRLQDGMGALRAEAEARGIASPMASKEAEAGKGVETAAPAVDAGAKQPEAKQPEVKQPEMVDAELAAAQAAMAKRRGQGR